MDCITKIERYVNASTKEDFMKNDMMQSGVIMQLALIGELSKRISDQSKKSINLPWKQIASFRDRAIHDYFELDLEYVWLTIKNDLPELKLSLENI